MATQPPVRSRAPCPVLVERNEGPVACGARLVADDAWAVTCAAIQAAATAVIGTAPGSAGPR